MTNNSRDDNDENAMTAKNVLAGPTVAAVHHPETAL